MRQVEKYRLTTWIDMRDFEMFKSRFAIEVEKHPSSVKNAITNLAYDCINGNMEHEELKKYIQFVLDSGYDMSYRNNEFLRKYINNFSEYDHTAKNIEIVLMVVNSKNFKISEDVFKTANRIHIIEFWEKLFQVYENEFKTPVSLELLKRWFAASWGLYHKPEFITFALRQHRDILLDSQCDVNDLILDYIRGEKNIDKSVMREFITTLIDNSVFILQNTLMHLYDNSDSPFTHVELFEMNVPIPKEGTIGITKEEILSLTSKWISWKTKNINKPQEVFTEEDQEIVNFLL